MALSSDSAFISRVPRADGRTEAALTAAEEIRADIFYHTTMAYPYDGMIRERYARGVLLRQLGRYDEALRRDADPELQPIVENARARLARLLPDSDSL